jgi:hypothetical protein
VSLGLEDESERWPALPACAPQGSDDNVVEGVLQVAAPLPDVKTPQVGHPGLRVGTSSSGQEGQDLMAGFMVLDFVLIYLRDFAPAKDQWTAAYVAGTHFETRPALGIAVARLRLASAARPEAAR